MSVAVTKLNENRNNIILKFKIIFEFVSSKKYTDVLYKNQCPKNKIDWIIVSANTIAKGESINIIIGYRHINTSKYVDILKPLLSVDRRGFSNSAY